MKNLVLLVTVIVQALVGYYALTVLPEYNSSSASALESAQQGLFFILFVVFCIGSLLLVLKLLKKKSKWMGLLVKLAILDIVLFAVAAVQIG